MQDMAGRVRQRLCHLRAIEWGEHTVAVDVLSHLWEVDLRGTLGEGRGYIKHRRVPALLSSVPGRYFGMENLRVR